MLPPILFFSFYLLAPLALSLLFKNRYNLRGLTFPIIALLIAGYPVALYYVMRYFRPPVKGDMSWCITGEMIVFMANLVIMVPLSLLVQFLFNRLVIRKIQ